MLVSLKKQMDAAQTEGFAVPAFNVYNMETMLGAVQAAEQARAPIILQVYARLFKNGDAQWVAATILEAARESNIPICFHLDHGLSALEIERAIKWGTTGIMFDGSLLSLKENIMRTKNIVELCNKNGVTVEGELGHIGSANDENMDEFTDSKEAGEYVRNTNVAALAILVGNAHGHYKKPPKLDIGRIADIYRETNYTPLVLHGGSGITDEQIMQAIKAGIRKVNFGTDVCYSFLNAVQREMEDPEKRMAVDLFMKKPVEAVKEFCLAKIRLLGAEGMAGKV